MTKLKRKEQPPEDNYISEIAKYNLENNTHFYKIEQVRQHQKDLQELANLQADYDTHAETYKLNPTEDPTDAYKYSGSRPETLEDLYRLKGFKSQVPQAYIGAAMTGPVAFGIATNPFATLGGLYAGIEGTKAFDNYIQNKTGYNSWGELLRQGNDWGTVGNFLSEFTNPVSIATGAIGGFAGNVVDNTVKTGIINLENRVIINNAFKSGKLQFGKPTVYKGYHQSELPITEFKFPFKRWDVINHGADPNGAFFTIGKPASEGFLSRRRFTNVFEIPAQKPLIQFGEILGKGGGKNNIRNAIIKYGRKHGADAVEFKGIADNQLLDQDILFMTDKIKPSLIKTIDMEKQGGKLCRKK